MDEKQKRRADAIFQKELINQKRWSENTMDEYDRMTPKRRKEVAENGDFFFDYY
jgi:hypothetical protein